MRSIDFEQMALELERIAAQIRLKPGAEDRFADRIESLAREMRREVNLHLVPKKQP